MGMRQLKISKSITNRESESLEKYLREINQVPLLTPDEETALVIRIQQGDRVAADQLVKANLRFVVSVAKQYQGQGLSLSDLINEGNVGLIRSIERFDPSRGFKFISFAVWWIRQSIIHSLAENARLVRLPLNKVIMGGKVQRKISLLEQTLGRVPSGEELAEALCMKESDVDLGLRLQHRHVSLDTPLSDEDDGTLLDTINDPNGSRTDESLDHSESLRVEIKRSFRLLTDRQKQTLCYFFGIGVDHPLSLEEIGRKFDLTTERVRQIKDKAIIKLRSNQNCDILRTYLRA
jgi:RNA polymerase primary sigma factor